MKTIAFNTNTNQTGGAIFPNRERVSLKVSDGCYGRIHFLVLFVRVMGLEDQRTKMY